MRELPNHTNDICFCPLSGILDVIAKKWALLIIAILGNEGERGFNELKKELGCISPKPLSDTLKKLERIGLVSKRVMATSPPSVKYSLTRMEWNFVNILSDAGLGFKAWRAGLAGLSDQGKTIPPCSEHTRNG
jgi:DNA-binding HxlR family transcriptional regulator